MRKNNIFLTLVFVLLSWVAQASDGFRYNDFGQIPIAHEGRIKPLSRYAALLFKNVTGHYPSGEQQGNAWLASLLFDPAGSAEAPQFYVPNKQVIYALNLPQETDTYSFNEINAAFLKKKKLVTALQKAQDPTEDEKDLLSLYLTATAFEQTKDALTLVLPLRLAKNDPNATTFLKLPASNPLHKILLAKGKTNSFFRIIPQQEDWITPWQSVSDTAFDPHVQKMLALWQDAAEAYVHADDQQWHAATATLYDQVLSQTSDKTLSFRLFVESLYQSVDPIFYSFIFYLAAFLLSFAAPRKKTIVITYSLLGTGLFLHAISLVARMIILQRPPVSTLYESVLFVGFMVTILFFIFVWKKKRDSFLSLTALSGVLFYLIALSLNDGQDDLKVLEAVLNTRFWLATHVMAITIGYALCVLTALMAHAALIAKAFKRRLFFATQEFTAHIYQISVWALLFVAGGTLLGGVWADQSWGRFWGWDPKENGALLIVLWLTWLLHAKVTKRFTITTFTFGLAFLGLVVGLSWIGVNLLGVGLHSYGFTSGLAKGFALFCTFDIVLLVFLWIKGQYNGAFFSTV